METLSIRSKDVRRKSGRILGTGFIVGDGKILTNHHVAQPWWKNDEMDEALKQGLQPKSPEMAAYFPRKRPASPHKSTDFERRGLSASARRLSGLKRPTLRLDGRKESRVSGQSFDFAGLRDGNLARFWRERR